MAQQGKHRHHFRLRANGFEAMASGLGLIPLTCVILLLALAGYVWGPNVLVMIVRAFHG